MPIPSCARRALVAGALSLSACGVSQPDVPIARFLAGEYALVQSFAEREIEHDEGENLALLLNVKAQCELLLGRIDEAGRSFARAGQIMGSWATGGGEATAAILGSESSKTYRGDPYEKAMNAFFLAFTYLLRGEPDNARAALKRGILADAEVGDERFQADNALLFWMAGRMSRLMGSDDADGFFTEARDAHTFALQHGARGNANNPVLAAPGAGNLVLLFPIGLGPEKYADGIQEELARFRPRFHPAVRAEVQLDGERLGSSSILVDVDYQARTLGGTEMEGIRKGKAVFKVAGQAAGVVLLNQAMKSRGDTARTQAIAGGALLLAGLLTSSAADVRHWPTLPSTVQVLTADVAPGEHVLEVVFVDAAGRPVPGLRHTARIEVPARDEAWYLFPSLPPATRAP